MYHKRKTNKDLIYVLSNLRAADQEELLMTYGENWLEKTIASWKKLKSARIGYLDCGKPVCVFGAYPWSKDCARVGMFATNDIDSEQRSFLILGKKWIKSLKYKTLTNEVYSANEKAIKWLKWLGFKVEEHRGVGDWFVKFEMKK